MIIDCKIFNKNTIIILYLIDKLNLNLNVIILKNIFILSTPTTDRICNISLHKFLFTNKYNINLFGFSRKKGQDDGDCTKKIMN